MNKLQREAVIRTALELLNDVGMEGLTTRRLAERLGVQQPALYWHFKNKTEVLTAMIDRERVPFIERLRRTTSAKRTTPILDLRSALLVSFRELAEDERLRNMMEIMLRNDLSVESQAMQALQLE